MTNDPLDDLYASPLAEFTERRNALAKETKAGGHPEDAAAIKALKKPTAPAWVVNQLHFRNGEELERLRSTTNRYIVPPTIAIITNIDEEHLDHYKSFAAVKDAFVQFANKVPFYGAAVVCLDDPHVQSRQTTAAP